MSMTPAQQNTTALMQALQFNADELILNRNGQLSPAQAQRVGAQLRAGSKAMWMIGLFVLVVFVIGFGALYLSGAIRLETDEAPFILLAIGGVMLVWGVMMIVGYLRSRAQSQKGSWPVYQASGRVKVNMPREWLLDPTVQAAREIGGEGVADGTIQVGRAIIAIWEDAASAFIPGNPYTVYYVGSKRGGLPVSAEAMDEFANRK